MSITNCKMFVSTRPHIVIIRVVAAWLLALLCVGFCLLVSIFNFSKKKIHHLSPADVSMVLTADVAVEAQTKL